MVIHGVNRRKQPKPKKLIQPKVIEAVEKIEPVEEVIPEVIDEIIDEMDFDESDFDIIDYDDEEEELI